MTDRVWAYAVQPARLEPADEVHVPPGGRIPAGEDLRDALRTAIDRAREGAWTSVVFKVEQIDDEVGQRRSGESRDAFLSLSFGDDAVADAAADSLARRLAMATDRRTGTSLLILAGAAEGDIGSSRAWTFPRDDAFRFTERRGPAIELLGDVFSRTSGLRKAARFDGEAHDASFLTGDALDFQTGSNNVDVADYWIGRFLGCQLGVTPVVGTQIAARALRKLDESLDDPEDRKAVTIAAMALGQSHRANWTLSDIADTFLPTDLRARLLAASEKPELANAPFQLDHAILDSIVSTRVYSLGSGVIVSAPISEVGDEDHPDKPVVVEGDRLRCQGTVTKEELRGRRRGQAA